MNDSVQRSGGVVSVSEGERSVSECLRVCVHVCSCRCWRWDQQAVGRVSDHYPRLSIPFQVFRLASPRTLELQVQKSVCLRVCVGKRRGKGSGSVTTVLRDISNHAQGEKVTDKNPPMTSNDPFNPSPPERSPHSPPRTSRHDITTSHHTLEDDKQPTKQLFSRQHEPRKYTEVGHIKTC